MRSRRCYARGGGWVVLVGIALLVPLAATPQLGVEAALEAFGPGLFVLGVAAVGAFFLQRGRGAEEVELQPSARQNLSTPSAAQAWRLLAATGAPALALDPTARILWMSPAARTLMPRGTVWREAPVDDLLPLVDDEGVPCRLGERLVTEGGEEPPRALPDEVRLPADDERGERRFRLIIERRAGPHPVWDGPLITLQPIAETVDAESVALAGRLAHAIAHDLNNCLQGIEGHAELALECDPGRALRESLEAIRAGSRRASGLANRLVPAEACDDPPPPPVDLGDALREMLEGWRPTLRRSVTLDLQLPDEPLPVAIDRLALEGIILNLVLNAQDAMPEGGRIRIAASLAEDEGSGDHRARLLVRDDGRGMDADTLQRACEPFVSHHPSGRRIGLGLHVTRQRVVASGGALSLDSAPGAGTEASILWPLAAAPFDTAHAPQEAANSPRA